MSTLLAFAALLQAGGQASAQADTPVHTVQSFVASFNRGDIKEACELVVGGKFTYPASTLQKIIRDVVKKRSHFTMIDLSEIGKVTNVSEREATVSVTAALGNQEPVDETLHLKLVDGRWLVSPPSGPIDMKNLSPLTAITLAAIEPVAMLAVVTPIVYASVGKQPEEGRPMQAGASLVLSYAAMKGDVLPKDFDDLFQGLASIPDEKSVAAFQPLVETARQNATDHHWVLNRQIAGKSQFDLTDPFHTVLIYEESQGSLDYRFNGKALVALANGVSKLVSPDEAMALRWIP